MPKKKIDDAEQVDLKYLIEIANKLKGKSFEKALQGLRFDAKDINYARGLEIAQKMFGLDETAQTEDSSKKKQALDAFMKLNKGYDQLSKTFNPEQKEIAKEADFRDTATDLVLSMREQIENARQDAKTQTRRFWISTGIAVASVVVAVVAIIATRM
jgi:hypothetical protein